MPLISVSSLLSRKDARNVHSIVLFLEALERVLMPWWKPKVTEMSPALKKAHSLPLHIFKVILAQFSFNLFCSYVPISDNIGRIQNVNCS